MKLSGEHHIPASRQTVWDALNDPETLQACLPGCETLEKVSDTKMNATITTKIGPVKATFQGAVTLNDLDPPNSYTLNGEGQGGPAGFASGTASIALTEADGGTLLKYEVKAKVGGKLAQIGSRLIDSVTKKLAGQFFGALVNRLSVDEGAEDEPESAADLVTTPTATSLASSKHGIPTPFWVVSIIAVVAVLILWAVGIF